MSSLEVLEEQWVKHDGCREVIDGSWSMDYFDSEKICRS